MLAKKQFLIWANLAAL